MSEHEVKLLRTTEPFDEKNQYSHFCELSGDKYFDRCRVVSMLYLMVRYIPISHLGGVRLIYNPEGASGTGKIEYKATLAWKYTPSNQSSQTRPSDKLKPLTKGN